MEIIDHYPIDYYIKESNHMCNTSDGGATAYHFDNVVLIRYVMSNNNGLARKDEESIMEIANKKRENGVNTPYHIDIKREVESNYNICWVLQERAKGDNFTKYYYLNNNSKHQLEIQKELYNLDDSIYEKYISDLIELFNMGLKVIPRNIYLDKENGFTFIDLLNSNGKKANLDSYKDIIVLSDLASFIYDYTTVDRESVEYEKSNKIRMDIKKKVFLTMEKVIPNFNKVKRYILRTYTLEELEYFKKENVFNEDLSFTEDEYVFFYRLIDLIINNSIKKIEYNILNYNYIIDYEIKYNINYLKLDKNYLYHKNSKYNLNKIICEIFDEKLESLENQTNNPNIITAINDLRKRRNIKKLNIKKVIE